MGLEPRKKCSNNGDKRKRKSNTPFKKKLHWISTFGKIEVEEQQFTDDGKLVRPFKASAGVRCCGYSSRLERVVTDFGADDSFADACKKIEEHYGVQVPISAARVITEKHATAMRQSLNKIQKRDKSVAAPDRVVAETDGCMVPTVNIDQNAVGDKRKTRKIEWREARLALARAKGSVAPYFAATIGSTDEAGKQLSDVVQMVGRNKKTRIHGLGDGALWIYDQFDKQFGSSGTFLIDFYHVSQYLSAATACCQPTNPSQWLELQQQLLRENKVDLVMESLKKHIEQSDHVDCVAQKCYQYLEKRPNQFWYKDALDQGLPIGSGEIESGNRSVVQRRLKIPGAWWLPKNADNMLALRTVRANRYWEAYWPPSSCHQPPN